MEDTCHFYYPPAQPNYITLKQTVGKSSFITDQCSKQDITGKTLLITNADPEYNWIFLHDINGFITKLGRKYRCDHVAS